MMPAGLESFLASGWWRLLFGVVLAVGGFYLASALWLFLNQARYVFLPERRIECTPARAGLTFEDVWLTSAPGVRIHAWWVPARASDAPVILFCHGNAGNLGDRVPTLALFHRLGFATLAFDYRGYGRSDGRPSEAGIRADAEAAWTCLVEARQVAPCRIVLFGRSLGGAVAAGLAQDRAAGALVLESTFTSIPDLAAGLYPWLPVRRLARIRLDTLAALRRVQAPVVVLHSPADEMIPFRHGQQLFAAATGPKWFITLEGGHNDGYLAAGNRYEDALRDTLAACLKAPRPGACAIPERAP